jgi:predicted NBD/HSP70 family sugar kinase
VVPEDNDTSSLLEMRKRFGSPTVDAPAFARVTCIMSARYPAGSYSLFFPRAHNEGGSSAEEFAKYVAAEINNLLVSKGDKLVGLQTTAELKDSIRRNLSTMYGQYEKLSAMPELQDKRAAFCLAAADLTESSIPAGTKLVGINIGQTLIKGYALDSATMTECRLTMPVNAGPGSKARRIQRNAIRLLDQLAGPRFERIACLGLSVGGMVRNNTILPDSGITLGLVGADRELILGLADTMRVRTNSLVHVEQDVEAKAQFYSAIGHRQCLVTDVGTSLGGCYISGDGSIPPYLNQIGRIAWNLSPSAPRRSDGLGVGLLSSYLSAKGIMALSWSNLAHAEAPIHIEEALRRGDEAAIRTANQFSRLAVRALTLICSYYNVKEILLTGGIVAGTLGRLVKEECSTNSTLTQAVTISTDPLFDSAVGVAWCALKRLREEQAPKLNTKGQSGIPQ